MFYFTILGLKVRFYALYVLIKKCKFVWQFKNYRNNEVIEVLEIHKNRLFHNMQWALHYFLETNAPLNSVPIIVSLSPFNRLSI